MNERLTPPSEDREITDEQKRQLIDTIRELAPFKGQPIDRFGSYETRFLYGEDDGYVSVYIPGLSGVELPDGFVDDAVRVIKRIPEDLGNGTTMVRMCAYIIHESDLSAEYSEDVKGFDTETGVRVGPKPTEDIESFLEAYHLEQELRIDPTFTDERKQELETLLASLNPDDTF